MAVFLKAPSTPGVAVWTDDGDAKAFGNTITVAESGAQHTTITAGLAAAVAGDVVMVYPGTYVENITVPADVCLLGMGSHDDVIVQAANVALPTVTLGEASEVYRLGAHGATGASGFYFPAGVTESELHDVAVEDCGIGILSDATGLINVRGMTVRQGTFTTLLQANAGANLGIVNAFVNHDAVVTTGIAAPGGTILCYTSYFGGWAAAGTIGANATANGTIQLNGVTFAQGLQTVVTGLRAATGGTILGSNVGVTSGTYDVNVADASGNVRIASGQIDSTKVSVAAGGHFSGYFREQYEDEQGTTVSGDFRTGRPGLPSTTVLGQGESNVLNQYVLTTDVTGAAGYIDQTANAADGTAFTLQGVAAGFSLLVGNSVRTFPHWHESLSVAAVLGGGSYVVELSDGASGWNAVNIMVTDHDAPHQSHANNLWVVGTGEWHVRLDTTSAAYAAWAQDTYNGIAAYWMRIRTVGGVTTQPTFSATNEGSIKCGTHHWKSHGDGFTEFFGDAVKLASLERPRREALTGGGSPGNVTWNPSANISWTDSDAGYVTTGDGVVYLVTIPTWLVTGRPIYATISWTPSDATVGAVSMTLIATVIRQGDSVPAAAGALTEVADPQVYTSNGTADQRQVSVTHTVSLPTAQPGDLLALSLQRVTAANPGVAPTINVLDIDLNGWRWK